MSREGKDSNWPMPKFYFKVNLGSSIEVQFQEVSGLEVEAQPLEYQHGTTPVFSTINMPGIGKNNKVTLKKGVFVNHNYFSKWYNTFKLNTIKRQNMVIRLCDESGNPLMSWTLNNALITKISFTEIKSDTNEVSVEVVEISHEGISIVNG